VDIDDDGYRQPGLLVLPIFLISQPHANGLGASGSGTAIPRSQSLSLAHDLVELGKGRHRDDRSATGVELQDVLSQVILGFLRFSDRTGLVADSERAAAWIVQTFHDGRVVGVLPAVVGGGSENRGAICAGSLQVDGIEVR